MNGYDFTSRLIAALEAAQTPYMLVGSLASNVFGIPRSTKDADLVVMARTSEITKIVGTLGPDFKLDPQLSFESVTGTKRQIVDVTTFPFRIELFHLSHDPHDQERFRRRRRVHDPVLHRDVNVATPEDTIVTKLRWAMNADRLKDRDDVRTLIGVRGDKLDWDYIHRWTKEHGTQELLDSIRATIRPKSESS